MKRGKENMVHDLKALSDKVSWKCADKEINLKITDAFFVSEDKETGLIKIDSGKEFIVEKVYYYTLYGQLVFYYDLLQGLIEWNINNKKKTLTICNIQHIGFFPHEQRILILCGEKQQELYGYTIEGKLIFKRNAIQDLKLLYFIRINNEIGVVCDSYKQDEYGRFRYNFILDTNNGELKKGSLAY